MKKKSVLVLASLCISIAANAAGVPLNGGVINLEGLTQSVSGTVNVTGVNYITNGTLLINPGTTLNFGVRGALVPRPGNALIIKLECAILIVGSKRICHGMEQETYSRVI
jgi:hypothetical protein